MWYQASPATTIPEFCFESPASETSFANSSANRNYLVEPAGWCGINRGNDSQRKTWPLIPQPGTASSLPTTASLKPRVQGSRPYAQVNRGTRRSLFFSNYDLRGILHVERARHKTEVPVVSKCLQSCAALISCCIPTLLVQVRPTSPCLVRRASEGLASTSGCGRTDTSYHSMGSLVNPSESAPLSTSTTMCCST